MLSRNSDHQTSCQCFIFVQVEYLNMYSNFMQESKIEEKRKKLFNSLIVQTNPEYSLVTPVIAARLYTPNLIAPHNVIIHLRE